MMNGHFTAWHATARGGPICRLVALLVLIIAPSPRPLRAAADPTVPDDTCIFELTGSTAATVSIDGHDYGPQREFTFDQLDRNRLYVSKVQVRFTSGATNDEQIIMRGGWRVRFAQDKVPLLTKLYFGEEQFVGFSGQGNSFPVLPVGER